MILAIDIGNSNIVLSLYKGNEWFNTFRYETKGVKEEYYYEIALRQIIMEWGIPVNNIRFTVISSVVPDLNYVVTEAIKSVISCPVLLLGPETFKNLDIQIPLPYEIGSDLVCNAYAGLKKYGKKIIVSDFGTALSFVVADSKEGILGVVIAPGLKTAANSLADQTAQLPLVPLEYPPSVLGNTTKTAIQSGIMFGYNGLFKEICAQIKKEMGPDFIIILTGGHVSLISGIHQQADVMDKMLTLEGMRLIGEFMFSLHMDLFQ
jgi:type III pantothenate kinase